MSELGDSMRRKVLIRLGAAAGVVVLAGALANLPRSAEPTRDEIGEPVLPGVRDQLARAGLIMVTTAEESYHIARDPEGWVLTEKGRFPVRDDRILALGEALASMTYARAMTRDDRKFDRIGLGNPLEGGTGALLEIGDGRGEVFAKLIVGRRDGATFIRHPDDLQAWAVSGEDMPPLQRATGWLDLDVLEVQPGEIAEVTVQPVSGRSYRIVASDGGRFVLASSPQPPGPTVSFVLKQIAEAAARLLPSDVTPATKIADARLVATHRTRLKSGLVVTIRAVKSGGQGWVTIAAEGNGAGVVNARTSGWAFALPDAEWQMVATSLEELQGG